MRHDLAVGELAHLLADRLERLIEAAVADRRAVLLAHQRDQARAVFGRVAGRDQLFERRRPARRDLAGVRPRSRGAHDLALAHRDAAERSGRGIRRARCARSALRVSPKRPRLRSCAPHRRRAGAWPRHRSQARRARARRAARGRAACPTMRPVERHPGARPRGGVGQQSLERAGRVARQSEIRLSADRGMESDMRHASSGYAGAPCCADCIAAHKQAHSDGPLCLAHARTPWRIWCDAPDLPRRARGIPVASTPTTAGRSRAISRSRC